MSEEYLLYSKFATMATQVSPLLAEMERRAAAYPADLKSLLEECQTVYFAARKGLLTPRLTNEIKGFDPANSELVELVSHHHGDAGKPNEYLKD
jgi:conserved oligomeric Golgi complex subunit 3